MSVKFLETRVKYINSDMCKNSLFRNKSDNYSRSHNVKIDSIKKKKKICE